MPKKPVVSIAVIVAFLTPYIATASGLLAAWLFVHLHWLGVFHLNQSSVARAIAGAVVFAVVSGLTYAAAHFHWLPIVIQKLDPTVHTIGKSYAVARPLNRPGDGAPAGTTHLSSHTEPHEPPTSTGGPMGGNPGL